MRDPEAFAVIQQLLSEVKALQNKVNTLENRLVVQNLHSAPEP